jgi:hypothetical protein
LVSPHQNTEKQKYAKDDREEAKALRPASKKPQHAEQELRRVEYPMIPLVSVLHGLVPWPSQLFI